MCLLNSSSCVFFVSSSCVFPIFLLVSSSFHLPFLPPSISSSFLQCLHHVSSFFNITVYFYIFVFPSRISISMFHAMRSSYLHVSLCFSTLSGHPSSSYCFCAFFIGIHCKAGWWFGTFGLFFHSVGNFIIPTDEYFSEG